MNSKISPEKSKFFLEKSKSYSYVVDNKLFHDKQFEIGVFNIFKSIFLFFKSKYKNYKIKIENKKIETENKNKNVFICSQSNYINKTPYFIQYHFNDDFSYTSYYYIDSFFVDNFDTYKTKIIKDVKNFITVEYGLRSNMSTYYINDVKNCKQVISTDKRHISEETIEILLNNYISLAKSNI